MPIAAKNGTITFPERKLTKARRGQKEALETDSPEKRTPPPKSTPVSISSSARQALHSSDVIIGRDSEIEKVTNFLKTHLKNQSSGSLYVSGLPGTGKTACVTQVVQQNQFDKKFHVIKINCSAFKFSRAVFKRICEELQLKKCGRSEADAISAIEKFLTKKHKMILLILDEIDQLESKSQSVLYKIFEWPSWENARFVLIGIANAIDLTDRNLPRLCAKVELKPILLHFAPYSKDEITEIIKTRLTSVGADKLFAPGAIELISAKVAGTSGDVRRALDLGRRVIEMVEQNQMEFEDSIDKKGSLRSSPRKENSPMKRYTETRSPMCRRTPRKLELLMNEIIDSTKSPPKRKLTFSSDSPKKTESMEAPSPRKLMRSQRTCLGEIETNGLKKFDTGDGEERRAVRQSPRKLNKGFGGGDVKGEGVKNGVAKLNWDEPCALKEEGEPAVRRSPRKLQFDVKSRDVLTVVKNAFGPSRNFKPNEESTFPLHQKLLICSLLLMMKKGKKKDCTVGKLHQVYSKVCTKRGLTSVDKSGFIFLCRQVEVTGIIQLGKGQGTLAKVSLQWDESEVTNSLKDLNLLSSILEDASCLV